MPAWAIVVLVFAAYLACGWLTLYLRHYCRGNVLEVAVVTVIFWAWPICIMYIAPWAMMKRSGGCVQSTQWD